MCSTVVTINNESHCEKFLALSAFGEIRTKPLTILRLSAEIPFEIMVDLVFFLNGSFCSYRLVESYW
jgi:hypothetical protein